MSPRISLTLLAGAIATVAAAARSTPAARGRQQVPVPLGDPIFGQALHYTAMYDEKPFTEAVLIYLRNGAYKIISPGEDHYGSYLTSQDLTVGPETVTFMSWPAADWAENVAWHTLEFASDSTAFAQTLHLPSDPVPKHQAGYAAPLPLAKLDAAEPWAVQRARFTTTFDTLKAHATTA